MKCNVDKGERRESEMTDAEMIVKNLQAEDYVEGPVIDILNKEGEMLVFGRDVKGREVYIKITLGYENGQTICISFHIAEHPLSYPFKQ